MPVGILHPPLHPQPHRTQRTTLFDVSVASKDAEWAYNGLLDIPAQRTRMTANATKKAQEEPFAGGVVGKFAETLAHVRIPCRGKHP
jgi:hypothetical protein